MPRGSRPERGSTFQRSNEHVSKQLTGVRLKCEISQATKQPKPGNSTA
ncbi:hypothetical protein PENANT_c003G09803 [Penicillium antarcticum]|uniref:Uncharacterized protein n=1 Tax=Penicillium antarcticum TaxID=416450 RepID=A0A1V6QI62_9EURO|nr:hypothetical protein PENANT_c003G09803 [Penicillium antarcticum]